MWRDLGKAFKAGGRSVCLEGKGRGKSCIAWSSCHLERQMIRLFLAASLSIDQSRSLVMT